MHLSITLNTLYSKTFYPEMHFQIGIICHFLNSQASKTAQDWLKLDISVCIITLCIICSLYISLSLKEKLQISSGTLKPNLAAYLITSGRRLLREQERNGG